MTKGHEITGIGLNMTVPLAPDAAKEPHNDYLRAYLEMGVLGILSFLAMLATCLAVGWRLFRSKAVDEYRAIGLAFLAASVAVVVASISDNLIGNVAVMWYFYALAAAAAWCLWSSRSPDNLALEGDVQGDPLSQSSRSPRQLRRSGFVDANPPGQQVRLPARRCRGIHARPRRSPFTPKVTRSSSLGCATHATGDLLISAIFPRRSASTRTSLQCPTDRGLWAA